MSISILIADGHELVLQGLAAIIAQEPDLELVGRVRDGRSAVENALELDPDVLVMSISLPVVNGIEVTLELAADRPQTKILCLSMHRQRQYVAAALEAGAAGYLLKDRASETLNEAIRAVAGGGVYLSPEMTAANAGA